MFDLPRKGCADIKDPAGDADANPSFLGVVQTGADPDLDITSVNFRTSATTLQAYIHVSALSATGPAFPLSSGHQFDVLFTVNKKAVDLAGIDNSTASGSIGGTATPALKVTANFDVKHSFVILTVDRASLAAATGGAVPDGAALTATSATSTELNSPLPASSADSVQAAKPADQVYTVGNNVCFLPPPAQLALDTDKKVQYSDKTVLYATLTDADNQPLGGVPVTAFLGRGAKVRATTDRDGIAQITIPAMAPAGVAQIVVSFAGNSAAGAVSATAPITVTVDGAVLTASGRSGTVVAALRDEDRPVGSPLAGQLVQFSGGGRKGTAKTNAKGIASLSGFPAGSTVTVSYAGSRGLYAAARSVSTHA